MTDKISQFIVVPLVHILRFFRGRVSLLAGSCKDLFGGFQVCEYSLHIRCKLLHSADEIIANMVKLEQLGLRTEMLVMANSLIETLLI